MEIPLYLSMTASEFAHCENLPKHTAWMACHFSPYSSGLTNIPADLPEKSLLILNDRTPIQKNDPSQIKQELNEIICSLNCCGVLLDLQRKDCCEAGELIQQLLTLPCPVCISDIYAKDFDCPVFLPPVPLTVTPDEYLMPWFGREIWLDMATECAVVSASKSGCQREPHVLTEDLPFFEEQLFLHYRTEVAEDTVRFYLQRTKDDVRKLLSYCASFGVSTGVGLWQELK